MQLALDRIADDAFVVLGDDGFDRQPVLRRRFNGAHVAGAGQRKVEGARNGGGAEGQHVDQFAQELELLLVQHAEALLLVNDHQTEIFERDVVLHQPVGADDDVHAASGQVLEDLQLLAGRAEARKQFEANWVIGHPFAKGVEVLLRQHGGGHEDCHLPTIHHRLEGGADGDFGFAIANVTADEAVHRLGGFHVGLGGEDGFPLVGGFFIKESALKLPLPGRVGFEGKAGLRSARRLDGKQFGRQVPHGVLGALFRLLPTTAAESIE